MILGIWVIISLFLGFPPVWDKILAVASGVLIVLIAYSMAPRDPVSHKDEPFVDHRSIQKNKITQVESTTETDSNKNMISDKVTEDVITSDSSSTNR